MNRSLRHNLATFKQAVLTGRWLAAARSYLYEQAHTRWMSTPNLYRERDIGYHPIAGQRVRCKQVRDTAGLSFFIVSPDFRLP